MSYELTEEQESAQKRANSFWDDNTGDPASISRRATEFMFSDEWNDSDTDKAKLSYAKLLMRNSSRRKEDGGSGLRIAYPDPLETDEGGKVFKQLSLFSPESAVMLIRERRSGAEDYTRETDRIEARFQSMGVI